MGSSFNHSFQNKKNSFLLDLDQLGRTTHTNHLAPFRCTFHAHTHHQSKQQQKSLPFLPSYDPVRHDPSPTLGRIIFPSQKYGSMPIGSSAYFSSAFFFCDIEPTKLTRQWHAYYNITFSLAFRSLGRILGASRQIQGPDPERIQSLLNYSEKSCYENLAYVKLLLVAGIESSKKKWAL